MTRGGRALLICFGLFVTVLTINSVFETILSRQRLPPEIETTGFVTTGQDDNLAMLMSIFVPIRAETCGAVLHNLSAGTKAAIAREGIRFFEDARQARSHNTPISFERWIETGQTDGIGTFSGPIAKALDCMGVTARFGSDVLRALRGSGSFYSNGSRRTHLVVIPAMDLVIYAWDDANHRPPPCSRVSPECLWSL